MLVALSQALLLLRLRERLLGTSRYLPGAMSMEAQLHYHNLYELDTLLFIAFQEMVVAELCWWHYPRPACSCVAPGATEAA